MASVRHMVITLYQTGAQSISHHSDTIIIYTSSCYGMVALRLVIIHKIWCYKVVLFDYQGFAPQDFSMVECGTTICTYLEKKGKKIMQMNQHQTSCYQVSDDINH